MADKVKRKRQESAMLVQRVMRGFLVRKEYF